jgi:hypothetical protein
MAALAASPDEHFVSRNEQEAMLWTKILGLLEKFPKDFALRDSLVASGSHPTHWLIAIAYCEKEAVHESREVLSLPRSKYTADDLKKVVGTRPLDVKRN